MVSLQFLLRNPVSSHNYNLSFLYHYNHLHVILDKSSISLFPEVVAVSNKVWILDGFKHVLFV